ncbi:S8/S53 family peptidase [Chryseobacterium salivictor]|uniref:Serine protease AprX n=1 Tax=Chryseobacterium salivictor TaxID=2547600 RepID=A0A4P6ZEY5_9FLAO|nr:S8/S53 family peptidase [Chryseobacterium salivictor]QBO57992.1 Serine protease AprX [Chryseobacterium salivictor]
MKKKLFSSLWNNRLIKRHWHMDKGQKALILIFLLFFGSVFGQFQKMDYKFEKLIEESRNTAQTAQKLSSVAKGLQLDQHLVVTGKGAQTMYSCIVYTEHAEKLKANGILVQSTLPKFVTALVTIDDLEKMAQMKDVISIIAPQFDELHNDTSRIQSGANLLQQGVLNNTNYNGEGVLVGIYDTGIDWKHPDFRDPNDPTKSRIISIWDQTLTKTGAEVSPAGFAKGVEYTKAQIEDELDGTPANFVRQKDINGHGTHVSATAAGNGAAFADKRHRGFAPNAGIVFVKGGDGSFPQANTIDAITYFQNVATALNKPIVFNMSIGGQGSAHDGTSPHEIAIDEFTTSGPGRVAVISAGNDYGTNIHRKVNIDPSSTGAFIITAGSSTSLSSVFSFYMYGSNDNDVTAKLTTPDGGVYLSPSGATTSHSIQGGKFTALVYNWVSSANYKRYVQVVITRNTGTTDNSQGLYTMELTNNGSTPMMVHGYKVTEGAASTLTDADNEYIVGSPGNSTKAITVASYIARLTSYKSNGTPGGYTLTNNLAENISSFSAQGPRADGFQKPDITASGQYVISAMSSDAMLAATSSDNIDGTYYKKNQGTSMSAPGVAGAVALLLQANPNITAAEVKAKLTANARQDAMTGTIPNPRWGFGKLDIYKTVADEIGCQTSETETIAYDEQFYISTQDSNTTSTNYVFAVKYTPTITGKLGSVLFYTGSGASGDIPVTVAIRTVVDGKPGQVLASRTFNSLLNDFQRSAWNSVDFSQFGLSVTTGKDFYVTIDASGGAMSLRRENINLDNRSMFSTDAGTTWTLSTSDYRIRAMAYEDKPQIKALATQNETVSFLAAEGKNYATTNCNLLGMVEKTAINTITGNVTAKVWLTNPESTYVARRYEITPETNPTTATGRVTLYFTQSEFDAYNAINTVKLPTSPTDEAGKANVLIDKFSGTSSDNSGTATSYTNGFVTLTPGIENVKWNPTYKYWEVTIDTTGFSGFFVRTSSSLLAATNAKQDQVVIYPNPVKDVLNIDLKSNHGNVKIFDLSGKVVKTATVNNSGSVDVSKLSKGMYIVEITTDGKAKVTKKIIKE